MNLELAGKVALVAGASRGIGLAVSQGLHAEGCMVALAARSQDALHRATSSLDRCSAHVADVTDPRSASELVAQVMDRWRRLDIVVCNAGSGASVPPGSEEPGEWERVLRMNLASATNVIAAVRGPMRSSGGGAIVCVSSICGLEALLGAPVTYSAAKAALNAAVRGLARPLAAEGIRINAVAPGNILFPGGMWERKREQEPRAVEEMIKREVALARLGTPQEIADVVSFLVSPRAAFVTGAIYVADGGQLRS